MKKHFYKSLRFFSKPGNSLFLYSQKRYSQACTNEMLKWLDIGYSVLEEVKDIDLPDKKLIKKVKKVNRKLKLYKGNSEVKLLLKLLTNRLRNSTKKEREEIEKKIREFAEIMSVVTIQLKQEREGNVN